MQSLKDMGALSDCYSVRMEKFMSNIKNKQHYVFQAYLKKWSDKNEKVWVCNKKEKRTFLVGTNDVLNKRRLYEIQDLNDDEKVFFELVMASFRLNDANKNEMRNHIDAYLTPYANKEFVDALKKRAGESANEEMQREYQKIDLLIKEQIANTEEDFYSDYESDGIRYINDIISGDTDFYYAECAQDNEAVAGDKRQDYIERDEFISFICIQYFRTIGMRNILKNNIAGMIDMTRGHDEYKFDRDHIRPESILPHMVWIMQAACSAALSRRNAKLQVIRNDTSLPFVTGDQPVINIKAEAIDKEPEEFVLYYPLSPHVAIMVNGSDKRKERIIEKKSEVDELNHKMLEHAYEYIVSNNQGVLAGIADMYL